MSRDFSTFPRGARVALLLEMEDEADITQPSPPPVMEGFTRGTLPSLTAYERESQRKLSPEVEERRKDLSRWVAGVVGVAWIVCQLAMEETLVRALLRT